MSTNTHQQNTSQAVANRAGVDRYFVRPEKHPVYGVVFDVIDRHQGGTRGLCRQRSIGNTDEARREAETKCAELNAEHRAGSAL